MTACCLLALALAGAGNEQTIDTFQYADSAAAARAWAASDGTPQVTMANDNGRRVVEMATPFASKPQLPRTVIDRKVKLDLSVPGEFALDISSPAADKVGSLSLYFRSGAGWYSAGAELSKKGWQTLKFSKASFRTEDKPAGWHKIDGIRISIWRGPAADTVVRLGGLSAVWHDVALVIPSPDLHRGDHEMRGAMSAADAVGDMLGELGLGSDAVDENAVASGALKRRRVAILAHNPGLAREASAELEQFVATGGKVLVCYDLPPALGKTLGFGDLTYRRPRPTDQFAEIRFDAADVPGLPNSVRQNSWNINTAEPAGQNARVIGRWFDPQGNPTGYAAMLVSDRGAFFSHLILSDDPDGKRQMLAAVLGYLDPSLWAQMVKIKLEGLAHVGHLDGSDELIRYVKKSGNPQASEAIKKAAAAYRAAKQCVAAEKYPQAIQQAQETQRLFVDAYLRATPSRASEGRAFWNHSGLGAYPGDWDRTAKELAAGGFNMVLPNMLWAGVAHYESDLLPRSRDFQKYGDQIAQCAAACKKHGLEAHIWKVNHNLSNAPRDFVERLRRAGRTQVSVRGEPLDWLCPSHPENFSLERDSMLEVARKYDVAGLHFDYIRYPDGEHCYCDGCRARFEAESGQKVANWPQDCYRGPRSKEYHDWRCQQITRLVKAVHDEAKKIKPQIKISAAVFGAYPACRQSVGQDWVGWIKAGYLDFVCPMDYTESDFGFIALVSNQLDLTGHRVPIYPGIGATASRSALSVDRVVGQIHQARSLRADGFTIFNLDRSTIQGLVPGIGLGAGSQRAAPGHKSRD
jgi:uncharacterized lipoprotein YddW (UPF0748 family)